MPEQHRIPGDTPISRYIAEGIKTGIPKDQIFITAVEMVVKRLKNGLRAPVGNQVIKKVATHGAERRLNDTELLSKLLNEKVNGQ